MKVTVASENLDDWANQLGQAAFLIESRVHDAVEESAQNVRDAVRAQWRLDFAANSHLKHLWKTVTYEVSSKAGVITADVGPEIRMQALQGTLGGIAEEGTVNNAPASPAIGPASIVEAERLEQRIAEVAEDLLDG